MKMVPRCELPTELIKLLDERVEDAMVECIAWDDDSNKFTALYYRDIEHICSLRFELNEYDCELCQLDYIQSKKNEE